MADRDTKRSTGRKGDDSQRVFKKTLRKPNGRKSKGKRHHVHAESLDHLAHDIARMPTVTPHELSTIFLKEGRRVRGIVR